jgi:hypothetical protein
MSEALSLSRDEEEGGEGQLRRTYVTHTMSPICNFG